MSAATMQKQNKDDATEARLEATEEMLRAADSGQVPELSPEMGSDAKDVIADGFTQELQGGTPEYGRTDPEEERKLVWEALGADLQRRAEDRVNARRPVEDRWLEDLRQYHSKYDPDTLKEIKDAKGSEVFVNISAPKTDGFAARMADMILPTDGKNWGLKAIVPDEVTDAMHSSEPVINGPDQQPFVTDKGHQVTTGDVAKGIANTFKDRCRKMEREMEVQLEDCGYNAAQRRAIDQVAQLGTMVLKGPHIIGRTRKKWMKLQDGTGVVYVAQIVEDKRPAVEFVDVWDFFPDLNSPDPEGWEDVFQRHYVTKRQLRELAKQPGFDKDAIRRVIKEDRKPFATALHISMLREITGEHAITQMMQRYELWEYHGPVTAEQLVACGVEIDDDQDPLAVLNAVIWFCEGTVLKAAVNPLEDGDLGYHVTWVKKDETSPFGFGIPRLMRHSQKVANASWRMVMDNAGLALAPQIIMAMGVIPADGNWTLYPGKIWIAKEGVIDVREAMQTFEMPLNLKELLTIFETALKLADEETAMPLIMQGDKTPAIPETAEGMAMLFGAASVIQRRFVRLYDDRITKPIITGLYDWNMAFHGNDEMKGDYTVLALGSSALLEKERYAQNVLAALNLCASPIVEPHVDVHGIIEEAFKALRLGDKVKDRQEAEAEVQRRAQAAAQQQKMLLQAKQGQPQDPALAEREVALKENDQRLRQMEIAQSAKEHEDEVQLALTKLAQSTGLDRTKLAANLAGLKLKEDNANARFNAEMRAKTTQGSGI